MLFLRHKSFEMTFIELLLIAIGLSMDAFSVSICKGLTTKKFSWRMALVCGLWFGFFQALMPIVGYFLGAQFQEMIEAYDHWIAFGLLFLIGANMIREAVWGKEGDCYRLDHFRFLGLGCENRQCVWLQVREVSGDYWWYYTDSHRIEDSFGASRLDSFLKGCHTEWSSP